VFERNKERKEGRKLPGRKEWWQWEVNVDV